MTTKTHPRKIKPELQSKGILRKCVFVDFGDSDDYFDGPLLEMTNWCTANVGAQMPLHPLTQYNKGWLLNYDDCNWAVVLGSISLAIKLGIHIFWFRHKEDRMLFRLTWSEYC